MRWLIATLLTANLLVALWIGLGHDTVEVPRPAPAPEVGELRLLSELPAQGPAQAAEPETPAAEPEPPEEAPEEPLQAEAPEPSPPPAAEKETEVASTVEAQTVAEPPGGEQAQVAEDRTAVETPPQAPPEAEVPPATAATAEPEQAPTPEAPRQAAAIARACWRLGPFESEEQAQGLEGRLPAGVEMLWMRQVQTSVTNGYFVLIPAAPDRAQALRIAELLKEKGVKDSWVFVSGPLRNAISLGMFSREQNARRRLKTIQGKGFTAEIRPRRSEVEQTVMLVRGPDKGAVERLLKQLTANQLERTACP
jgi:outer membrane biosynthesis protein TonB